MTDFTEDSIRGLIDNSAQLLSDSGGVSLDGQLLELAQSTQTLDMDGMAVPVAIFALTYLAESELSIEEKKGVANAFMKVEEVSNNITQHHDWVNENGGTLLHVATLNNSEPMIEAVINAGTDVNAIDNNGDTALHHAIGEELSQVTLLLLSAGAMMNIENDQGHTPLDVNQNDELQPFLDEVASALESHAITTPEVESRNNLWKNRQTIFHYAVRIDSVQILEEAIAYGFNLREVDKNGDTILHYAALLATAEKHDVLDFILQNAKDIDLYVKNNNEESAIDSCKDMAVKELMMKTAWKRAIESEEDLSPRTSPQAHGVKKVGEEEKSHEH